MGVRLIDFFEDQDWALGRFPRKTRPSPQQRAKALGWIAARHAFWVPAAGPSDNFLAGLARRPLKARGAGSAVGAKTSERPLGKLHGSCAVGTGRELAGALAVERVCKRDGLSEKGLFEGQRHIRLRR